MRSRRETSLCLRHFVCFVAFLQLSVLAQPIFSQDTTRIALLHFEQIGGDTSYAYLEEAIPRTLKGCLNRSRDVEVRVDILDEPRLEELSLGSESRTKIKGLPKDEILKELLEKIQDQYDYLILGRLWEEEQIVTVEGQAVDCESGKTDFRIHADEVGRECGERGFKKIEEFLAPKLLEEIETNLGKRIRIGIIDFKMTGGDTSQFKFLEESIPTMLGTGLSVSRRIKLIEMKQRDDLVNEIIKGKDETGIFDLTTALRIGNQINANYLIMGEFWHYKDKMRTDARCVNIETGEIVLSEGINLECIEIERVSDRINTLASQIRITIEKDFLNRTQPSRTVAVVSLPPFPKTRSNKVQAKHVRKAVSRKLRLVSGLRVKEDPKRINHYLNSAEDRMKICCDLGVSTLLTIEFESYGNEHIILGADGYDIENPTSEYCAVTKEGDFKEIDTFTNEIVFDFLRSLGIECPRIDAEEIRSIRVPKQVNRYTVGMRLASIERRDRRVFLDDGIGEYGEVFVSYHLENHFEIECLVGYDRGRKVRSQTENTSRVYSVQPFVVGKYNFLEDRTLNPYAGFGIGSLLLARVHEVDAESQQEAGAVRLGLMTLGGIELQLLHRLLSLNLELRWLYGQEADRRTTSSGYVFEGGHLGGFYVTGGAAYNFNF